MKTNMGIMDRILRLLVVAAFLALYFGGVVTGVLGMVLVGLAVVFFLTSFSGYCPIYAPFGFNTCEKSDAE